MHPSIAEMFNLHGKVALVTGGARDLGNDAASVLAAAGADVAVTSRRLASAESAAARLGEQYQVGTLALALDQTRFEAVAEVITIVSEWKGHIDILVNNAGGITGSSSRHLLERAPADIAAMIDLNLTGALYCCREAGRVMAGRHAGKIINIASIAGMIGRDRRMYERTGLPGQPVDYAAAKAGVIGMSRDLAAYLAPMGVQVNSISPGGFERGQPEAFISAYSDRTPMGRMGRDGIDLKGAVLFLASPASDYITGANLVVDGGFVIWH